MPSVNFYIYKLCKGLRTANVCSQGSVPFWNQEVLCSSWLLSDYRESLKERKNKNSHLTLRLLGRETFLGPANPWRQNSSCPSLNDLYQPCTKSGSIWNCWLECGKFAVPPGFRHSMGLEHHCCTHSTTRFPQRERGGRIILTKGEKASLVQS